ncbi:MAG: methyltransferase domain-containing protein [Pseudohongiellaceae bacterium]|nr:methyltransferase domain-containing protein [Pseudohongiellaceae bacterium]
MSQNSKAPSGEQVLASWHKNAAAWVQAIRSRSIQSRELVTNQAIIDAIAHYQPKTLLDVGCGEGWLSWHFAQLGCKVTAVDAIAELVEAAQQKYPNPNHLNLRFEQLTYRDINRVLRNSAFDIIACNFSLLDKEDTTTLLHSLPSGLTPDGHIVIQTLHPCPSEQAEDQAEDQADGWRKESWKDIGEHFQGEAPWYYRSLSSWKLLFSDCKLAIESIIEPMHPSTKTPASIIFVLRKG